MQPRYAVASRAGETVRRSGAAVRARRTAKCGASVQQVRQRAASLKNIRA